MTTAREWIDRFRMIAHPEGGYYTETYRSGEIIRKEHLPRRFDGDRSFSTAIVFLLPGGEFSALHRIKQDEVWHFYDGAELTIHVIDTDGAYTALKLGRNIEKGETPQAVVEAGCLFGATVDAGESYALVGCTVAPGFDFADFDMPERRALVERYPQHKTMIETLTR